MSPTGRSCMSHHAWRYISIALICIALITGMVPLSFESRTAQRASESLSTITSGWFFLGLFWNIFVVSWEGRGRGKMHPGAVVGLDLCMWSYSAVAVTFGVLQILFVVFENDRYYGNERWMISRSDFIGSLVCFSINLGCATLILLIHIGIFVQGCIDEDKRLKGLKAANNAAGNAAGNDAALAAATAAYESDDDDLKAGVASGAGAVPSTEATYATKNPPSYINSINAAVAAKEREIERQEREFGNGNYNRKAEHGKLAADSADGKIRNW